jgi:hypothetical protein
VTATEIIEKLAAAVASLRAVLEAERLDDYARVIEENQQALDLVQAYPNGVEGLREAIELCAEEEKTRLRELLILASQDHQINAELIRLGIQKNAALRAVIAQESDSATYSDKGDVPNVMGSLLSRKV